MTNEQKVVRDFERFVDSGYKKTKFTKPLYETLSRSFGFIAHFDREGFYTARFGYWAARVETLQEMTAHRPRAPELKATEKALSLIASMAIERARAEMTNEIERSERVELARLKAKYE